MKQVNHIVCHVNVSILETFENINEENTDVSRCLIYFLTVLFSQLEQQIMLRDNQPVPTARSVDIWRQQQQLEPNVIPV